MLSKFNVMKLSRSGHTGVNRGSYRGFDRVEEKKEREEVNKLLLTA